MLIAGILHLMQGKMLPGALFSGKICTTVLFFSLILLVLLPDLSQTAVIVIAIVDTVFLIYAFVNYILAYYGKNKKVEDLE